LCSTISALPGFGLLLFAAGGRALFFFWLFPISDFQSVLTIFPLIFVLFLNFFSFLPLNSSAPCSCPDGCTDFFFFFLRSQYHPGSSVPPSVCPSPCSVLSPPQPLVIKSSVRLRLFDAGSNPLSLASRAWLECFVFF